ncbi:hypothetical protein GGF31_005831 [Allomyces arbusculus]|nr:hypothetical protein GGF31_005831 [Allomyces arbusculus]
MDPSAARTHAREATPPPLLADSPPPGPFAATPASSSTPRAAGTPAPGTMPTSSPGTWSTSTNYSATGSSSARSLSSLARLRAISGDSAAPDVPPLDLLAHAAADVVAPCPQPSLATTLPHELLLKIFADLLPRDTDQDPMCDDEWPDPPRPAPHAPVRRRVSTRSAMDVDLYESDDSDNDDSDASMADAMDWTPAHTAPPPYGSTSPTSSTAANAGSPVGSPRPASPASAAAAAATSALRTMFRSLVPGTNAPQQSPFGTSPTPAAAPRAGSPALMGRASPTKYSTATGASHDDNARAKRVSGPRPRPHYRNLHPCLFVCKSWYHAAVYYLHAEPVLENVFDFLQWLASLEFVAARISKIKVDEEHAAVAAARRASDPTPLLLQAAEADDAMDVDNEPLVKPNAAAGMPKPGAPVAPLFQFFGQNAAAAAAAAKRAPATPRADFQTAMSAGLGNAAAPPASLTSADPMLLARASPPMPHRGGLLHAGTTDASASGGGWPTVAAAAAGSVPPPSTTDTSVPPTSRAGLAGFSHLRVVRFEQSNHVTTVKGAAFRLPVRGSLHAPNAYIRDEHINRIAAAFQVIQPRVASLDLRNCANVTDVAIIHLITTVSSTLRALNVTNCRHIKDVTVRTLARVCDGLEDLVLRGCGKVGDASVREVAQYLGPQLRRLDVSGCMRINDPGLDFLAKYSGNYQLSEWETLRAIAAAREAAMASEMSRAGSPIARAPTPTIARATSPTSPTGTSPPQSPRPGSPTSATAVVAPRADGRVGGKLTTLCIPGIRRQSRGGLVAFLQEMVLVHPHLTDVEFSIPAPPSTSTKSMFSGGPALFGSLTMLTSLTIRECEYLDDSQVLPIAQHCTALQSLTLLNASGITEASFVPLVMDLRHLRTLVIRGARHLTDAATAQLVQAECAPRLERLDLSDAYDLSDETLYTLASVTVQETVPPTPVPQSLTLVTPVLPPTVRPVFAKLQHVALENCRRITFRGVMAIARVLAPYDPPVPPPAARTTSASPPTPAAAAQPAATATPRPTPAQAAPAQPASVVPHGKYRHEAGYALALARAARDRASRRPSSTSGRSLVSLHVSGAWEGVTQKATVIYRERANAESAHRDIHLVTHAARGLVRDEYDVGAVGSGGAPMLWTIFPAQQQGAQPQRPPLAWFCRFARSALRRLLDEYVWIPVPVRVHAVVPAAGVVGGAGAAGVVGGVE